VTILLVEDNAGDARLAREMLRAFPPGPPEVVHVSRLAAALPHLSPWLGEAVVLDLGLPDSQGLETLVRVRAAAPKAPIVVTTGRSDEQTAIDSLRLGAQDYVVKGRLDSDTLVRALRYAMERKRTELRLRDSEEQYRLLFVKSPQPMWVVDEDTLAFLAVNDTAIDQYGWSREQFLSMSASDLEVEGPGLRERLADATWGSRAPGAPAAALRHRLKDGSVVDVEISASPIPFQGRAARLVQVTDVTQTRRLEAQLRQAQKMEAVGQLAGGIAHDFNNLLSVILGQGELIHRELGPGHRALVRVAAMQSAADRAAGLTRQLLAFGRRQLLRPEVIDLNELVTGVLSMLHRLLPETIEIVTSLQPRAARVRADRGQFEQVLVNLALNARDAMPDGGRLVLTTADADLDEAQGLLRPDLPPGPYVVLGVEDTGHGMDAETLARAFEPFFTTKAEGRGTGLGLAMVYGIVKQTGGHVTVYSEPGRGSSFKVYLPRVRDAVVAERREPLPAPAGGSETLLVVEDQDAVRSLLTEILRDAGYRVVEAASAEEASRAALREPGEIHLLLTDVVLPRASGPLLVRELRSSRPGLRVVLMSGYAAQTAGQLEDLGAGALYIQKPFAADALLRVVREALDSGP
jgi:two-component system, cell cycle sensor histidine kinase and response regulator CckA